MKLAVDASHRRPVSPLLGHWLQAKRRAIRQVDLGITPNPRGRSPWPSQVQVARLAGCSPRIYKAIENSRRLPGPRVLKGIVKALQLTEVEHAHLHRLAQPQATDLQAWPVKERATAVALVERQPGPAYAVDHQWNLIATSAALRELVPSLVDDKNLLRWFFCRPEARRILVDWAEEAIHLVGSVRAIQAYYPHDPWYEAAMADIAAASPAAERLWHRDTHISPLRPMTTYRLRCAPDKVSHRTVIHVQPAGGSHPGLHVALFS